jgi:hypothetical protein
MFSVSDLLFKLNCWWVFLFFSFNLSFDGRGLFLGFTVAG